MKKLESFDDIRQERYEHNGKVYSIINLTIAPLETNGNRAGDRYTELMKQQYHPFIYELADITNDNAIMIDRYSSIEDAKEAIMMEGIITENGTPIED